MHEGALSRRLLTTPQPRTVLSVLILQQLLPKVLLLLLP